MFDNLCHCLESDIQPSKPHISNTSLIRELYAKLAKDIREVNTIRAINCKGSGRIGHTELIICNYS